MSDNNNALVVQDQAQLPSGRTIRPGTPVAAFVPQDFAQAQRIAMVIAESGMAPKSYQNNAAKILVGMMTGAEVGLTPMQSLRGVAVIGNQPSLWGDVALGLVLSTGLVEDMVESVEGDFDDKNNGDGIAICTVKRKGRPTPVVRRFSLVDARRAGLLTKDGPWKSATPRMCQMRARGFALRDLFPDVLAGLNVAETEDEAPTLTELAATARPVRETTAATVDDLHEQAKGLPTTAAVEATDAMERASEAAKADAEETTPKPRKRVRSRSKADESANEPEQDKADDAPAAAEAEPLPPHDAETGEIRKTPAGVKQRMEIANQRELLQAYEQDVKDAEAAGDERRFNDASIMVGNLQSAIAKLEAEFDFSVQDAADDIITPDGYDLNKNDPKATAPDPDGPVTLDEAVKILRSTEILMDAMNYTPKLAVESDKLMFESERAKHIAGIRQAAKRG